MDNIAGSPVEGDNFFGRAADVSCLREVLANDDLLLLGPRRIGKTSIARAVMASVRSDGWRAIEINVASCLDERGFLDKLDAALTPELASIGAKAKAAIMQTMSKVRGHLKSINIGEFGVELAEGGTADWPQVACDLLRLIGQVEGRWLIYVDELPILLFNIIRNDPITGVQRVRRFLDWFRNDVRALPDAGKVRWLVSGSVGLDTLVQQHGMADTINSMCLRTLDPFEDETAVAMLLKLADRYGIHLTADEAQNIVAAVQWPQPYYLQKTFNHLRDLLGQNATATLASLIERAIDKLVQPGDDNDFHHWEGRLSLQLCASDAGHARALLTLAANDPTGARPEQLLVVIQERMMNATADEARTTFLNLRDILQRDAYWWPDESSGARRYRFRLEPLRRWWVRRNAL